MQSFLTFFFKQYKRTKTVKVTAKSKRKRGHTAGEGAAQTPSDPNLVNVTIVAAGDALDADEDELAKLAEEDDGEERDDDGGQEAHDKEVVSAVRKKATADMAAKGVFIAADEEKMALGVFPKVRPNCSKSLI